MGNERRISYLKVQIECEKVTQENLQNLRNEAIDGLTGELTLSNGVQLPFSENEVFDHIGVIQNRHNKRIRKLQSQLNNLEGKQ